MTRARRRSIYCSPLEWAEIAERADAAGMSVSAFLIACALAEDEPPATVLTLTGDEQRAMYERIESIHRWTRGMTERLPGTRASLPEAVDFLYRVASAGKRERRE